MNFTLFGLKKGKINYRRQTGVSIIIDFKNNKTLFELDNGKSSKITKLTKDELWVEGDPVFPVPLNTSNVKVKAKYSSKE